MIRPEVRAHLTRWREAVSGAVLFLAGAILIAGPGRAQLVFGGLALAIGLAAGIVGSEVSFLRRLHFVIGPVIRALPFARRNRTYRATPPMRVRITRAIKT